MSGFLLPKPQTSDAVRALLDVSLDAVQGLQISKLGPCMHAIPGKLRKERRKQKSAIIIITIHAADDTIVVAQHRQMLVVN